MTTQREAYTKRRNKAESIWRFIRKHQHEGVTDTMLIERYNTRKSAALVLLEQNGYLTWTDEKGKVYPYRKVSLKEPPKKSIPFYFTRWLDDDAKDIT